MMLNAFETELVNTGHATTEEPSFTEPQTLSGNYRASNGFWYHCGWNNGVTTTAKIGYSDQYLEAVLATERTGIVNLPDEGDAWERGVRAILGLAKADSESKINKGRLFFPKPAVNGFAADAAYQRANTLAKEIGGVVVSSDQDIHGARPSFWVYRHYADVPAKDYSRIEEDYSVDESWSDYGFTKITLPKIGEVLARAVGADSFWRNHICNATFRAEIIRSSIAEDSDFEVTYEKHQRCSGYELNWFDIPESEREKLIVATDGILDEYFSARGLRIDEENQLSPSQDSNAKA